MKEMMGSMIIDSHAHVSNAKFDQGFRYLSLADPSGEVLTGTRRDVLEGARAAGIAMIVEPAIDMGSNDAVVAAAKRYPDTVFPAVGLHPTRTHLVRWRDRSKLDAYADTPGVVAIGETGLDFHDPRRRQHRLAQYLFFGYQIRLAGRKGLPLILHIRDADRAALRVLRARRGRIHGGVVHCYRGDWDTAREYLDLGLHIGVGGALLQDGPGSDGLRETVRNAPLDRIVVETDAPFVLPMRPDLFDRKHARKIRNSPLILPEVVRRIAEIRGISQKDAEDAILENTLELFGLPRPRIPRRGMPAPPGVRL